MHCCNAPALDGPSPPGCSYARGLCHLDDHDLELYTGIEKCADPAKELRKVTLLLDTVGELVFDTQAAREAGRIRALLERQGCMIGAYDVLLAGHAVAATLTLVTANTGEFSRVPELSLENWQLQPAP